MYRFFRLPLTVFFLSRTAARASAVHVWESLGARFHVRPNANDRAAAAAVATDSPRRVTAETSRGRPRPSSAHPFEREARTGNARRAPPSRRRRRRVPDPRTTKRHRCSPPSHTHTDTGNDDGRPSAAGPERARRPGGVRFALPRRGVAGAVRTAPSVEHCPCV